jgi:hypothetical protein
LTATTSNPTWYVQQLAAIPVAYRIDGGPELREAARAMGRRLLSATGEEGPAPGGVSPAG